MDIERDKVLRFLQDGSSTMFVYEMRCGYEWMRHAKNISLFKQALNKLTKEIKDNRGPSYHRMEMLIQLQERKKVVWMEGPAGWTTWMEDHNSILQ